MEEELVRIFLEGELGRTAKYKKLDPALVVNAGPDSFNPFFLFLDRFRGTVEREFDLLGRRGQARALYRGPS